MVTGLVSKSKNFEALLKLLNQTKINALMVRQVK